MRNTTKSRKWGAARMKRNPTVRRFCRSGGAKLTVTGIGFAMEIGVATRPPSAAGRVDSDGNPPPEPRSRSGRLCGMAEPDPKADLHRYLQAAREALLWKLDGLSEYDIRRPMVPTGTNLLGLVKHVASVEAGYFGETFGRPFGERLPWFEDGAEPNADMCATAEE